jgi:CHAD domain-containing protein
LGLRKQTVTSHEAMSDPKLEYLCPPGFGPTEVLTALAGHWRLAEEPARGLSRVFYDTFDWALFADGGVLERRAGQGGPGSGPELVWSPRESSESAPESPSPSEALTQPAPTEPSFAAELPTGPLRSRILKVAGIRRLLPMMGVETRIRTLRALDDDDKTLWRAALDESRFRDPQTGREGELALRVRVLPLRGYEDERDALLDHLTLLHGLSPAADPLLVEALEAAGRRPCDYSSKIDFRLDPRARADAVTKTILLGLLDTLERNRDGARANLDSEFLHDLRVAVRRTRSALAQIRPVLPDPVVEHYKERFAWLQQITGAVRDLDVYLLDFTDYQASLPPSLRPHLEPMRAFILAHYDAEQRRLAETLDGAELKELLVQWRTFLEAPVPASPEAKDAASPIKSVADARIWRMAKRVRREGRVINSESPATDMHELRKSCKKLRYLMEFFQSLYPEDDVRPLIRLLKELLDNLGSFQDLAVQAAHLRELAERMRAEGKGDTDTLLAMGALIGQVLERQQRARDAFGVVFAGFLDGDNQDRLRRLFHPGQNRGRERGEDCGAGGEPGEATQPDAGAGA